MTRISILAGILLLNLLFHIPATAQHLDDITESDTALVDTIDYSISDYNKYTPLIGGKEFRYQNGLKINGMIKDLYPDSSLKHKGYYTNGQLVSVYKNYYPNGQMERSFAASGNFKLVIESFYPNSKPKEYIEYRKGEIIKYIEYFPNGNMATYEEHEKKKGYYLSLKNYYKSGVLQNSLTLMDAKKSMYEGKEFYANGKVKEEGPIFYNAPFYDYQRHGTWSVYNEEGTLIETREYYEGELIQ